MSDSAPSPTRSELARELLRYKMLEYSQEFFCATWLVNLEFELWESAEVANPGSMREYVVSLSKELRILAEIAGGWWVYEHETRPSEDGPVYIPMDRWLQVLSGRNASPEKNRPTK